MDKAENLSDYDRVFLHVFAPVIVSYVEWVMEQAAASGKKRLYFLARDGWLMFFAAEQLAKNREIDLDLRYLKVSRYSLRMAEYMLLGEGCLDTMCVGGIDISFRKIMMRAAFTEQEIRTIAEAAGYEDRIEAPLNYMQIQKLKERLRGCSLFFEYVYRHSKECYDDTAGYLRQEGLFDNVPYATVDSGWIGTTQRSLEHLASHEMGIAKEIEGYYFGVYEAPKDAGRRRYHGYYIRPGKDIRRKAGFSIGLFETIFSSPEGMTYGYRKAYTAEGMTCGCRKAYTADGERQAYFPIESINGNPNGEVMLRNRMLLYDYLKFYMKYTKGNPGYGAGQIEDLLKLCMGHPTKREAQMLGNLKFCDDVLELQLQNVAAVWDKEELEKQRFLNKLLIKLNMKEGELHESGWPEASMVNLGQRSGIRQEHLYKYFMYLRKAVTS